MLVSRSPLDQLDHRIRKNGDLGRVALSAYCLSVPALVPALARFSTTGVLNVGRLVQIGGVEGEAMFDAKFKLAAVSLIRAALVEGFDTAELIISYGPTS
jgi:hypothetical protein